MDVRISVAKFININDVFLGVHYIGFCRYFSTHFADTDIFPFVWKQHQVSPVQKL